MEIEAKACYVFQTIAPQWGGDIDSLPAPLNGSWLRDRGDKREIVIQGGVA